MKIKQIYIYLIIGFSVFSIQNSYASEDRTDRESQAHATQTQHPPHDHHETDHIKKLDEAIQRRRRDQKKSN